jgi:hypothetical protein
LRSLAEFVVTSEQFPLLLLGIVWFVQAGIVEALAGRLGRSRAKWFAYGVFVPIVSLVHVLLLTRRAKREGLTPRPYDPR